ncbi:ribosome hibernation-promoting factor, HPF/YfiA family [Chelatococcus reniformis]|uniref:Ribosome hibernation promoting factor n=1 Tax=Chelatococcus reniformis TaxID=1494448 RepID=A0A916TXC1_9HYPH|nr:ribosome-associated translation inhibitor RaiA [Chelatococcus reniformis]GGC46609.1 ribosome hibernation promotion factor [Chelatococcus reniformis]
MTLRVSGKNMDIGEALRGQIESRVNAAVDKYFDGSVTGHVTITRDGSGYRSDCGLHLSSGMTLEASGTAHDPTVSFDQMAERIEKRLRRYNGRLKGRSPATHGNNGADALASVSATVFEAPGEDIDDDAEYHPVVVAEMSKPLYPLSVSEAVMRLDMTGAPILVFRHAGTSRVNVVYRRNDGTIGWIDPPTVDRDS